MPIPVEFRCDRCGADSFPQMWRCPQRDSGCPFQRITHSQHRLGLGLFMTLFGSMFVAVGLFFVVFMGSKYGLGVVGAIVLLVFLLVFAGFGGFILLLGMYTAFGNTRSLVDSTTKQCFQDSSLLGVRFGRRVVKLFGTLPATERSELKVPASIAGLRPPPTWKEIKDTIRSIRSQPKEEQKRAISVSQKDNAPRDMMLATVLDLAARGQLTLTRSHQWRTRFYSSSWKEDAELILARGPNFDPFKADGDMEHRLLDIVGDWSHRNESAENPFGPTGKTLIREILGSDSGSPGFALMRIVFEDARQRGWAEKTSKWLPTFQFTQSAHDRLDLENARLKEWLDHCRAVNLETVESLAADIEKGIKSRESSD